MGDLAGTKQKMLEPRQLELTQTLINMGIAEIQKTVDSDNNPILIIIPTRNQSTNNHDYVTIQFKIGETPSETTKSCESACGDYLDPNRISALGKFFTDCWEQIERKSESNFEPESFKSKYQLLLDDYLVKSGIIDMRRIGSNLIIIAKLPDDDPEKNSRRLSIKIGENETPEDLAEAIEIKCDKPLGRLLTQYIIHFVCKPENWNIINPSEENEEVYIFKPKYQFHTFEEWQLQVGQSYHNLHKVVDDTMPAAWPAIEYILSVKAILHIKEITLPYIGIILGPPSGYKTVPLELLRNRNRTFL